MFAIKVQYDVGFHLHIDRFLVSSRIEFADGVYRCVAEKLNARFTSVPRKKWLSCAASRARANQRSVQNARRDIIVKVHAERVR